MLDLALDNRIFVDNALDAYVQEIDMIFGTTNTELIGDTSYGTNFESFLWTLSPSESELRNYIYDKLNNTFFGQYFNTYIEVEILKGVARDIYSVRLTIQNKNENITKTYIYK